MGDALDTLTPRQLFSLVRASIGPPDERMDHIVDVVLSEIVWVWPAATMAAIAANMKEGGDAALDAIAVITAKTRENLEARWEFDKNHAAALDLVLRACVIESCRIWFSCPEARIGMRNVIRQMRKNRNS